MRSRNFDTLFVVVGRIQFNTPKHIHHIDTIQALHRHTGIFHSFFLFFFTGIPEAAGYSRTKGSAIRISLSLSHTHTHTRARSRARAHTHCNTKYVIPTLGFIVDQFFPRTSIDDLLPFQLSSVRGGRLPARSGKPICLLPGLSEKSLKVAPETVLILVWLTMTLAHPFKVVCRVPPPLPSLHLPFHLVPPL